MGVIAANLSQHSAKVLHTKTMTMVIMMMMMVLNGSPIFTRSCMHRNIFKTGYLEINFYGMMMMMMIMEMQSWQARHLGIIRTPKSS